MSTSALQSSWLNSRSTGGGTPGTGTFTNVSASDGCLSSDPAGPTTNITLDPTKAVVAFSAGGTDNLTGTLTLTVSNDNTGGAGLSIIGTKTSTTASAIALNLNQSIPTNAVGSLTATGITNPATGAVELASGDGAILFTGAGGLNSTLTMNMAPDFAVSEITASGNGLGAGSVAVSGGVSFVAGDGISFDATASTAGVGGVITWKTTASGGVLASGKGNIPASGSASSAIDTGITLTNPIIVLTWAPDSSAATPQVLPAVQLAVNAVDWATAGASTFTAKTSGAIGGTVGGCDFYWALLANPA